MKGLIVKHLGRCSRVGSLDSHVSLVATLVLSRDEFIFEGGDLSNPFISSFQKIKEGIEVEIEIAEFGEPSEPISIGGSSPQIDPEYTKMISERDREWELNWKLRAFRELEATLKERGLLNESSESKD